MGFFPFDMAGHADTAGVVLHIGAIEPERAGKRLAAEAPLVAAQAGTLVDHGIFACG
jgi:hypothetical protein